MWPVGIIVAAALICVGIIQLGFIPPPHAVTLIRIRGGKLQIAKGIVRTQAREFISDILNEATISNGFIAMTPGKNVAFSWKIPSGIRQRLRNVLLNS